MFPEANILTLIAFEQVQIWFVPPHLWPEKPAIIGANDINSI
jgi:hypothetical protein